MNGRRGCGSSEACVWPRDGFRGSVLDDLRPDQPKAAKAWVTAPAAVPARWQGRGHFMVRLWPASAVDDAWAVPPTLLSIEAVEPAKGPRNWYAGDADIEAGAWLSDQALRRRRPTD